MALLPQLNSLAQQPYLTNTFAGYNHNPVIGDGEMYDMRNMSGDKYPLLSTRKKRCVYKVFGQYEVIDFFRFTFENGTKDVTVYIDEYEINSTTRRGLFIQVDDSCELITELVNQDEVKKHVKSGAQIVFFMRRKFSCGTGTEKIAEMNYVLVYNLLDKTLRDTNLLIDPLLSGIKEIVPSPEGGYDGKNLNGKNLTRSSTAPANPSEGDYWLQEQTVTYEGVSFKTYHAYVYIQRYWVGIGGINAKEVQIKVEVNSKKEMDDLIAVLSSGRKISIKGLANGWSDAYTDPDPLYRQETLANQLEELCKDASPTGYHVHEGESEYTWPKRVYIHMKPSKGLNIGFEVKDSIMKSMIGKAVPDMDHVCESNNRIWGCYYGLNNGEVVNEVYASALGSPEDFYLFESTNADSWAASIGTDGPFTGCIHWSDSALFFKERYLHRVGGTMPSTFNISTLECRGVQNGSWKSMAIVDEKLYYKSVRDVMMYDGSIPQAASDALGDPMYRDAVGGRYRDEYYVSMMDEQGKRELFVYNTSLGTWHHHDDLEIVNMVDTQETLFAITTDGKVIDMMGFSGDPEEDFDWEATFGISGYEYTGDSANISRYNSYTQGYLSRFNIRVKLDPSSSLQLWLMYDSDGTWKNYGEIKGRTGNLRSFTVPVVPRRCDHCRLRLTGHGGAEIYSIARIYTSGGDGVPRT